MDMEYKDKTYHARVWRTEHLKDSARNDLERMFFGLLGDHQYHWDYGKFEVPGFPYASPNKIRLSFNNICCVQGDSQGSCFAKAIAAMLDGCWYPLT